MSNRVKDAYTQDDAMRHAVRRAARDSGATIAVYRDSEAYYVRATEAAKPKDSTLVCIAERWDRRTVQVRYSGARSEFVSV